jgi:hypothetical protein
VDTLLGISSGVYTVWTDSGTRHIVNLDDQTVIRYGAPGNEWGVDGAPDGIADGDPFRYTWIADITVGERMFVEHRGSLANPDYWRRTSVITHIEPHDTSA